MRQLSWLARLLVRHDAEVTTSIPADFVKAVFLTADIDRYEIERLRAPYTINDVTVAMANTNRPLYPHPAPNEEWEVHALQIERLSGDAVISVIHVLEYPAYLAADATLDTAWNSRCEIYRSTAGAALYYFLPHSIRLNALHTFGVGVGACTVDSTFGVRILHDRRTINGQTGYTPSK